MSTIFGFFLAQIEALLAGAVFLGILRCTRLPFGLLASTAWLAGSGLLSIEYLLLAQAGVGWTPLAVLSPWLPLLALAAWRLRAPADRPRPSSLQPSPVGRTVDIVVGGAIAVWTAALMVRTFGLPLMGWDALTMWIYKGRLFFGAGTVPTGPLADPYYVQSFVHMDYPLLVPLTVARIYQWIGDQDVIVKGWWSLLAGSVAAGLYFGLDGMAHRIARLGGLVLLVGMPATLVYGAEGLAGLADLPLAAFFLYAAIFLYRWLISGAPAEFVLSATFFGMAGFTKNEGVIIAAAGLGMLVLLAAIRKRLGRSEVWVGLAVALAAIVPWQIEKALLNITGDLHPTVGDVLQNWQGRIGPIMDTLLRDMGDLSVMGPVWFFFLPLALGALLFMPRRWLLALPLLLLVLAHFIMIVLAFVTTPHDLTWHLTTSDGRLIFQATPVATLLCTIYVGMLLEGVRLPSVTRLPAPAESAG